MHTHTHRHTTITTSMLWISEKVGEKITIWSLSDSDYFVNKIHTYTQYLTLDLQRGSFLSGQTFI